MGTARQKDLILFFAFVAIGRVLFWFYRPSPPGDLSRVEPRLLALQKPYQKVATAIYLDGGSVGVEMVDRNGKQEQFAVPTYLGKQYSKVFVGGMYEYHRPVVEVADSEQTKRAEPGAGRALAG